MTISKQYLTVNRYSRPGTKLSKVTKVAVHYTGDPGATAQNERDYFNNMPSFPEARRRYVSSHYIVGLNGEIIQCIPEDEFSYCTNEANSYSISIETCHPDATGKFTAAAEQSLVELAADICKRHGLDPQRDVIRHYDVTGKVCPKWYVDHPGDWQAFKERVAQLMADKWAVRVQHFSRREDADELSATLRALSFYNEVHTDPANGKYVVDVFSFSDRTRADALAYVLNQKAYSVVRKAD